MSQSNNQNYKDKLTPEEFKVLREAGTEPAFSGEYVDMHAQGMFKCKACGQELFSSANKFDSGSGWPSFDQVAKERNVEVRTDSSHGMIREEVVCSNCKSHLGHRFSDGPRETTGERYCINSVALAFEKTVDKKD